MPPISRAYRCFATKEELDKARAELKAKDPKAQFVYPGWWRERRDWPEGKPYVIRFKTPKDGVTDFEDRVFGRISTPNDQIQDFVLLRSDGFPLYNFSCVIDDHDMQITLVGRGRDHIGNTPQQVLLYQALGWQAPEFAHLPMMLAPNGEKLSKRHAAVSVMDYRDRGYTPMGVLNYLVRFGWSHGDQEIFSREELIRLFDWQNVNKSDGKYDERKFLDTNFEHLKQEPLTGADQYVAWVTPLLAARGLPEVSSEASRELIGRALPLIRERARTLVEAAQALDYFFREPPELDPKASSKFLLPKAADSLLEVANLLADVGDWQSEPLETRFRNYVESRGLKIQDVAQPVRVALTGRSGSPPLFDVMAVLGRERSLGRLRSAAESCRQR
jgi:glutamyl-tRNA synthetase